ncbi:hypothetical protein A1Q2_02217 [Trichosporon asahii var. asahii CBS 8904]|jgi:hypothetical protein|uniref:Uncharacterized protein n=2 Tax=Trichosporon asahii var. asahii TaxID=189963 RepID=K1WR31_TRIAC|nr:hypothetical protein A1Q1_03940 [Trichosporon asahii var. asahii CBS 2479]EJT47311.1 hypothetical protein A1Q1_03940 [Trichosporon asahii var. asahii CBS 2479]EKD03499.1 hypothetical protein A1Q2_02217 [Trichosporon asahii var. asahii CBS 8904]
MHFASNTQPTLTPLGVRLINVSRHKLSSLEPAVGGRDSNDLLRRGVLVREALRSAWATLDTPAPASELTDWRAPDALGLSVLSEEDEEEAEERWLDDVLSDMEDDSSDSSSDWAETTVGMPDADEDDMMCCEFEISHIESVELDENYDELVYDDLASVVVHVAAVCDDDDEEEDEDDAVVATAWLELPRKHSPAVVYSDDVASKSADSHRLHQALSQLASTGTEPRADFIEADVEELEELPALQRCSAEDDEDDDDDCCRTPPLLSCEDLEEIAEDTLWQERRGVDTVDPLEPEEASHAKTPEKKEGWRIHHAPSPVALLLPP